MFPELQSSNKNRQLAIKIGNELNRRFTMREYAQQTVDAEMQ